MELQKYIEIGIDIDELEDIIRKNKDIIYLNFNKKKNNLYIALMTNQINIADFLIKCDNQLLYSLNREYSDYLLIHLIIYDKIDALDYLYQKHYPFLHNSLINNRHRFISGAFNKSYGYNYLQSKFKNSHIYVI